MEIHGVPFVGSEALAARIVKKHQLRKDFRAVVPDVYVDADLVTTQRQRAEAAWLWSHREGVVAGLTASALHGAKWVDEWLPTELVWCNARGPRGVRTFDLGRRGRLDSAVARLDALGNATGFVVDDVVALADRHRGARGLRQLTNALDLYDPGSASPKETWLRLLLIGAGFPRPRTQIRVRGASGWQYYLDMGWEDAMVAVEYDGDQHRLDRPQFVSDILRLEELDDLGWNVLRVVVENTESEIIGRVHRARNARLREITNLREFAISPQFRGCVRSVRSERTLARPAGS